LVVLAEDLEAELDAQLKRRIEEGNDAAIAYELVLLLSDFNVFRQLRPEEINLAIRRLTRGLSYARYLVERYPNVPAYETLAIHTAYKLAVLQKLIAPDRRDEIPERIRIVRTLMRLALRGQQRLLENSPGGDGYAMWCALFTMQIGDLQRFAGDRPSALQSYRGAAEYLPLVAVTPDGRHGEAHERSAEDRDTLIAALEQTLRRYAETIQPDDAEAAQLIRELIDDIRGKDVADWPATRKRIDALLGDAEESEPLLPIE